MFSKTTLDDTQRSALVAACLADSTQRYGVDKRRPARQLTSENVTVRPDVTVEDDGTLVAVCEVRGAAAIPWQVIWATFFSTDGGATWERN